MYNKFKLGDRVRVVNYGAKLLTSINLSKENFGEKLKSPQIIDPMPYLIGKAGIIEQVSSTGGYAIEGIPEKYAWYDEQQLELIEAYSDNPQPTDEVK
jgi:hypothetical protein